MTKSKNGTMEKKQKKIKRLAGPLKSKWRSEADFRLKNRKWLRYSSNIARRVLSAIEDNKELNQKILAGNIGVKPQYISRIVQGNENLTLETIAKLSESLNVELISFPDYKHNMAKYDWPVSFDQAVFAVTGISLAVQQNDPQPLDWTSRVFATAQFAVSPEVLVGESQTIAKAESMQIPNKAA
jgi:hypothetical protein